MKRKKIIKKLKQLGFEVNSEGYLLFRHSEIAPDSSPTFTLTIEDIQTNIRDKRK